MAISHTFRLLRGLLAPLLRHLALLLMFAHPSFEEEVAYLTAYVPVHRNNPQSRAGP
jgi:hypothetical protein